MSDARPNCRRTAALPADAAARARRDEPRPARGDRRGGHAASGPTERFAAATGLAGRAATALLDCTTPGTSATTAGAAGRCARTRARSTPTRPRGAAAADGGASLGRARVRRASAAHRSGPSPTSAPHALARAAPRARSELLDTAQEFGRLGIWEREIPSGEGRWDRHVFGFWGLDPAAGTPNYDEAIQHIHPEDRAR